MNRVLLFFSCILLAGMSIGTLAASYSTMGRVEIEFQAVYDDLVSQNDMLNRTLSQIVFVVIAADGEGDMDAILFNAKVLVAHAKSAKTINLSPLSTFLKEDSGQVVSDLEQVLKEYRNAADVFVSAYRALVLEQDDILRQERLDELLESIEQLTRNVNRYGVAIMQVEAAISREMHQSVGRSIRLQFYMLLILVGFMTLTAFLFFLQHRERRKTLSDLGRSEERLRKVVARSPLPMCIIGKGQKMDMVNDAFVETFGHTRDAYATMGQWFELMFPEADHRSLIVDTWNASYDEAHLNGRSMDPLEWRVACKDGRERDIEVRMVALDELSVITMVDLTEFRMLEADLVRSRDEAREANRAKSSFLANMSHEIRTPLNGVMGMLQLLRATDLDRGQEEYVSISLESCKRLTTLLSDILDLSRVEAGRLQLRNDLFRVREKLENLRQLYEPMAVQQGLEFSMHIDDALAESLRGDATRMQQILGNLVSNAIKFTQTGSIDIDVWNIRGTDAGKYWVLFRIVDTGIGMDDMEIRQLLEPFTQRDSSFTRRYQGAGLGLSIVRRLVELMNGSLTLNSRPGKGTEVFLSLPFSDAMELPEKPRDVVVERLASPCGKRILVVEDDQISRISLKGMLMKMGYEVGEAINGEEAIAEVRTGDYNLVFMDIQLPILDGMEATRTIRSDVILGNLSRIPIIALTAYAMTGDRKVFLEAGMDDYLAKPVEMDEVREMVRKHICDANKA